MPVYTYHCDSCEIEFDKQQSFVEDTLKICPECNAESLRKVYKPAPILFKGSGYYVTDNKSSSKSRSSSKSSDSKTDSPKVESPKEKIADKSSKKTASTSNNSK